MSEEATQPSEQVKTKAKSDEARVQTTFRWHDIITESVQYTSVEQLIRNGIEGDAKYLFFNGATKVLETRNSITDKTTKTPIELYPMSISKTITLPFVIDNDDVIRTGEDFLRLVSDKDQFQKATADLFYTVLREIIDYYYTSEPTQYFLLASEVLHSYVQELNEFLGYIGLVGTYETGKNNCLTVVGHLSHRASIMVSARPAHLIHLREDKTLMPTVVILGLDNTDLEHNFELRDILEEGYKAEGMVPRIPDGKTMVWFPIFSSKLFGANSLPSNLKIRSRMIVLQTEIGIPPKDLLTKDDRIRWTKIRTKLLFWKVAAFSYYSDLFTVKLADYPWMKQRVKERYGPLFKILELLKGSPIGIEINGTYHPFSRIFDYTKETLSSELTKEAEYRRTQTYEGIVIQAVLAVLDESTDTEPDFRFKKEFSFRELVQEIINEHGLVLLSGKDAGNVTELPIPALERPLTTNRIAKILNEQCRFERNRQKQRTSGTAGTTRTVYTFPSTKNEGGTLSPNFEIFKNLLKRFGLRKEPKTTVALETLETSASKTKAGSRFRLVKPNEGAS